MKICFLMGSANISGGSYVIFEHALYLHRMGIDVTIVTLEPLSYVSVPWHDALGILKFTTFEAVADCHFDVVVATWWKTIYELSRVDADHYIYFVQSIESWFYSDADVAVRNLANATYLLPLAGITEARWIKAHLADRFGHDYHLVPNGCAKTVYTEDGPALAPRQSGRLRVLIEGPVGVDFKNVARTVAIARRSNADEVWLLTSSKLRHFPGVDRVISQVPASDCPTVYRSCDVLVKLSYIEGMFGPPLEMFHCGGTAIVYDVTGYDEYIVDGENALVVATGDEDGVLRAINRLKEDPALLAALKEGGRRTAQTWPDWPDSSSRFCAAIQAIVASPPLVSRHRIGLTTAELFRQYVRSENALRAARGTGSFPRRVIGKIKAVTLRVGKCLPANWRSRLYSLYVRFVEERAQPEPRTKI